MTTITDARDVIMGVLNAAWLASVLTQDAPLLWDGVVGNKPPAADSAGRAQPWARGSVRHLTGQQDTMGRVGRRRYLSGGVVTMQLYTPFGDGYGLADQWVEVVKAALRAPPPTSRVWFFDIVTTEIGEDGPWTNTNVEATFRYQEIA